MVRQICEMRIILCFVFFSLLLHLCLASAAIAEHYSGPAYSWKNNLVHRIKLFPVRNDKPIVYIPNGGLEGSYQYTVKNERFFAFQSIPYAKPPTGRRRFAPPEGRKPWNKVRNAMRPAPSCIQANFYNNFTVEGQEDCLYLNVYTRKLPDLNYAEPLVPVIVAFHGGFFISGNLGFHGPRLLMEKACVLVSVNYRLGAFGFLSTGDDQVPGNMGMKDQVLALEWVKENIKYFGGDPDRVTIHGGGGASTHYHLASPLSRGLFHRAIMPSGSAFCPWAFNKDGVATTKQLATLLNCPTTDSVSMVQCLRSVKGCDIAAVHTKMQEWAIFPLNIWAPAVEPNLPGAFLPEHPMKTYKEGRAANVTLLAGLNSQESSIFVPRLIETEAYRRDFNDKSQWPIVGPASLVLRSRTTDPSNEVEVAEQIRYEYMGTRDLQLSTRFLATEMFSDRYFTTCTLKAINGHLRYTNSPVYTYFLDYRGERTLAKMFGVVSTGFGAAHQDNDIYLYDNQELYPTLGPTEEDFKISDMMIDYWFTFARDGIPTATGVSKSWVPNLSDTTKSCEDVAFLNINVKPKMIRNPFRDGWTFFKQLRLRDGTSSLRRQDMRQY